MKNNKGLTLLELVVYMALAVFLLAPVIMLMNTSSKNMTRSASRAEMYISGRDVLNIMYDDIKNLGFKLDPGNFSQGQAVAFYGSSDSSSFISGDGPPSSLDSLFDILTFIKGKLDGAGAWSKPDTIRYYVDAGVLKRGEIDGQSTLVKGTPQVIAQNIVALQFQYADSTMDWAWTGWSPTNNTYGNGFPEGSSLNSNTNAQKAKKAVKYIKIALILKNDKKLSEARNRQPISIGNISFPQTGEALYERHEITVPVPNNGLFPP